MEDLPVDLNTLSAARESFEHSGSYGKGTARERQRRFREELDPSSKVMLARSVLLLHKMVSEERKRAPWVREEQGVLLSDVEVEPPSNRELRVGAAWRNDYYLAPLQYIVKQLAEVREVNDLNTVRTRIERASQYFREMHGVVLTTFT